MDKLDWVAGLDWVATILALAYFRSQWPSQTARLRRVRWLSALLLLMPTVLVSVLFFGKIEFAGLRVFLGWLMVLAGLTVVPGLFLTFAHAGAAILEKFGEGLGKRSYEIFIALLIVIPACIAAKIYHNRIETARAYRELKIEVQPMLASCCAGHAQKCLRAPKKFEEVSRANTNMHLYDLRDNYLAEACELGDQKSCEQFAISTGMEEYRDSYVYKLKCSVEDGGSP
ncbi:MAG: hypothetical protein V4760_02390 [Bdellovibrionota bacterium]